MKKQKRKPPQTVPPCLHLFAPLILIRWLDKLVLCARAQIRQKTGKRVLVLSHQSIASQCYDRFYFQTRLFFLLICSPSFKHQYNRLPSGRVFLSLLSNINPVGFPVPPAGLLEISPGRTKQSLKYMNYPARGSKSPRLDYLKFLPGEPSNR